MRILTNFERFPEQWQASSGESGRAIIACSHGEFLGHVRAGACDLILVNCDAALTLKLGALFWTRPWLRKPAVAVDLVLRAPESPRARVTAAAKKLLFARIDHFIHYFRDLRGYRKHYGIGPERSTYVPFKSNLRYRREVSPDPEGEYLLCFGRSLRDYDTFFEAASLLPYPAAIPRPRFEDLRTHRSRFTRPLDRLPRQVRILDDDGSRDSLLRIISSARLVVLPILKSSICASGIGIYLDSMLLGKCVLISEGPGASDVLTGGEALLFPPEDPQALAAVIRRAWQDSDLRLRTARLGQEYAWGLGGEPELRQRVLDAALRWYGERRELPAARTAYKT